MERFCRRRGLWRKIICVKGPQSSVSSWICQNVRQFILPCSQIWGLHDDPLFCEKSKQTRLLSYSQTIAPVVTENSSVSLQEQVWWRFWNFSFSENLLRFFFSELSHLLSGFQVWFLKFNFPQDLVNRKKTLIFLHFQSKTTPRGKNWNWKPIYLQSSTYDDRLQLDCWFLLQMPAADSFFLICFL